MKLAAFRHDGRLRMGVVDGDRICDVSATSGLPTDPIEFLDAGPEAMERAAATANGTVGWLALDAVELQAPVPRPRKFVAIGLNYMDHIRETGRTPPDFPVFFTKQSTCVVATGDDVEVPKVSSMVDYEGELAVVIGRRCRHVPVSRFAEVVAGYTIVNDVTVRDWQRRAPTMMIGKSFDTHGPMGPWMVTPDELTDPHDCRIRTWVNGELRQDCSTSEMVFSVGEQIATLSAAMTLEPGDVISTGTPAGVGVARDPQLFLRAGDAVQIEIDRIGVLENRVVDEPV